MSVVERRIQAGDLEEVIEQISNRWQDHVYFSEKAEKLTSAVTEV
ncbi:hypothetical protein Back11_55340 [Paenibacillus baekrokdamisoli]|uniref:Uncharacterized protein n=1 Tax=Paenibacillus baekrokdamisoli TaxID=1712516 RepID=A0A3G9JMC6_9BACL|nr:hypothetical protein [Paenibacillus baekrokdamisoli]MBB3071829.1 muramidase (phage lysozyme) [Paenibacillus baekrokdamisoli]BBH24189.1 hypothetical protein Back11_55340 [Paenibacillus baekrokdamisoli]